MSSGSWPTNTPFRARSLFLLENCGQYPNMALMSLEAAFPEGKLSFGLDHGKILYFIKKRKIEKNPDNTFNKLILLVCTFSIYTTGSITRRVKVKIKVAFTFQGYPASAWQFLESKRRSNMFLIRFENVIFFPENQKASIESIELVIFTRI
jgi:hypothetical protein